VSHERGRPTAGMLLITATAAIPGARLPNTGENFSACSRIRCIMLAMDGRNLPGQGFHDTAEAFGRCTPDTRRMPAR